MQGEKKYVEMCSLDEWKHFFWRNCKTFIKGVYSGTIFFNKQKKKKNIATTRRFGNFIEKKIKNIFIRKTKQITLPIAPAASFDIFDKILPSYFSISALEKVLSTLYNKCMKYYSN